MNCNLFGALSLFQACLPSMRARGDGRLIFVTSGAANNRPPGYLASYAASKAALASLVRSIAIEHGKDGIRCNGVHLGPVDGENFRPWIAGLAEQKGISFEKCFNEYLETEFPLRYVPTARECAGTVPYLASDLARVVTGQGISVNGGQWFAMQVGMHADIFVPPGASRHECRPTAGHFPVGPASAGRLLLPGATP